MKRRIFMGFGDLCGYYSQLEEGFRELGIPCTFVNAYPDRAYSRKSAPAGIGQLVEWIAVRRAAAPRGSLSRRAWSVLQLGGLAVLFVYALIFFDVFIFSGGTTFFFQRDLRLLKLFGKKVVVVFHGSDSRPPYLNAAVVGTSGAVDVEGCIRETRLIKRKLQRVERYADIVVNHSMNAHLHERPIINWLHIGIPFRLAPSPAPATARRNAVTIVHAPTRPGPKGTVQIERAIERLQERGHRIRFIKLVDEPHHKVLAALADCDFVVDELFSDTTMASFATEAAAVEKPAIVGMEGFENLCRFTPHEVIPPAVICRADEVEAAIEKLIVDHAYRSYKGHQARRFLEERWNVRLVAERFARLAAGDIPVEWWFDPGEIDYLHGWGLSDTRAREVLRTIINQRGLAALLLSDKPALERMCVEFAAARVPRVVAVASVQ
jgi:hypothetical protein